MLQTEHAFIQFGSKDSQDKDIAYVFDTMPEMSECKEFCKNQNNENRNIIMIQEGVVADCFKGLPDEMNNSLLETYSLHKQLFPNPVQNKITRIVPLKVVRAIRIILSLLSRTIYRSEVKAALKSYNQQQRINVLQRIDFTRITLSVDDIKSIAAQLAQTLAVINGKELYTKQAMANEYPELEPLLYRHIKVAESAALLNLYCDDLISKVSEVYVRKQGTLNLFCYISSVKVRDWNRYNLQCRGLIIDLKQERCITFPYEKFFKLDEIEGWMLSDLPNDEPCEIVEKIDGSFVSAYNFEDKIHFACKGSFDAEQAIKAKTIAQQYRFDALDFDRYNYTFEVVYPDNNFPKGYALVNYGESALFLTGIRDRLTHTIGDYNSVKQAAITAGVNYPKHYEITFSQLLKIASAQTPWENKEGWVANFQSKRVKIKLYAYNRINDIANGIKKKNHRLLKKYVKFSNKEWEDFIAIMPEEFLPPLQEELQFFHDNKQVLIEKLYEAIDELGYNENQKEFVSAVNRKIHPAYQKFIFRIVKNSPYENFLENIVLKNLLKSRKEKESVSWDIYL